MIVIAGKNDIAIHGLLLAIEYFNLDEIIVITNKFTIVIIYFFTIGIK